ncbi:MAG: sugar phosphate isomerase/epimerase family protein [Acetobacteraceae bacterium]
MRTDKVPVLGLAHLTALEVPPLDLVPLARAAGFGLVGLRLCPAQPGGVYYALAPGSAALAEMRRRMDGDGVRVHDIEIVTIDRDFDPATLAPVLDQAAALGARRLSACGEDPDRARLVARFAALCELAASYGIGVDLEWMGWRVIATLADAIAVVTACAQPNAAVLVDALHLARNGGVPDDVRALPAGLVRSAQLCDAPTAAPASRAAIIAEARGARLAPGAGALPLSALLDALPEDTILSCEIPMAGVAAPAERARLAWQATAALFGHE